MQNESGSTFRRRRIKCRRVRKTASPAMRIAPTVPPTTPPAIAPAFECDLVPMAPATESDREALDADDSMRLDTEDDNKVEVVGELVGVAVPEVVAPDEIPVGE